ncbi:phosphate regulon sensor histidine kinase PhoR [Aromatoleum evansii]|uniref:phosphate regulon sensor histidine kinase PhoR n=1 Tax=Aromatoleum evansii TaxID=59406 RepID=UPI00145D161F|nr:phosphate regulon sensor histidine kinase PhoR [Aromatoleum evansii]NMG28016.1 phosphate regulon sensor histidine kinase PhoR [Aromatoleum evansii]
MQALRVAGLVALLALIVGAIGGKVAALAMLFAGLLAMLAWQLFNLQRLVEWMHAPRGVSLPAGVGIWAHIFYDLDRRSRTSADLRERLTGALDRFHEASQAMPDGVLYLSANDRIEWLNRKAEQQFGIDGRRDHGALVTTLVREPEFVRFLQGGDYAEPLVLHSTRRAGLTLLVQVVPFGDKQKMVVSRDVSQLEKLETMRRDFIANVSHELRTPLTVVTGFLETLIDGRDDFAPEDVTHFLQLALDQSLRMQALIEDLLALSALETGAPAAVEERVDVASLVRSIAEDTRLLSNGRHEIEADIDARAGCATLLGSEKELRSAFANLASNAVRYTPAGGRIRLSWSCTDGRGEFAVEDNGIGIAADDIPRLTERFYRVDRGRSRETGGTGLGLAIVKHILSRHQAELRIVSAPGKGSRFSACFPLSRLEPALPALRS